MARWPRRASARRATLALAMAATCLVGLVAVGVLALAVDAGHELDSTILHGFAGLYRSRLDAEIEITGRLADPIPYAGVGLLCVAVALARGRRQRALAVGCVLVGTGLTTHALKHLLEQPRYADWLFGSQLDPASWPSGHATAAMTLVLCGVMVAPPGWRAATALVGSSCAVAVAYATLALTWHYPSDILAGFLVAGLGVSVALAVLARTEASDAEPVAPAPSAWLVAAAGAAALAAAALVGAASRRVALDVVDRTAVVLGALAISGLAIALGLTTVAAASQGQRSRTGQPSLTAPRHESEMTL